MIDEKTEREKGRDYLWGPIYQLLENGKIRKVLNVGGGTASEWIDLVRRYKFFLHIVDQYEGHGLPASSQQSLRNSLVTDSYDIKNLVEITKENALSFKYKSNEYDLVYTRYSLHHIVPYNDGVSTNLPSLINKFHKALRSGGSLYIMEVGRRNLLQIFRPFLPSAMRNMEYVSKTNLNEYVQVINNSGFTVIETQYYVPYKLRWFRKFLANATANSLLTSSYRIFAIKD